MLYVYFFTLDPHPTINSNQDGFFQIAISVFSCIISNIIEKT